MSLNKKIVSGFVVASTAFVSTVSNAAIDVSAATNTITTDGGAAITTIGLAMLGLAAIAVTLKWSKAAIFG